MPFYDTCELARARTDDFVDGLVQAGKLPARDRWSYYIEPTYVNQVEKILKLDKEKPVVFQVNAGVFGHDRGCQCSGCIRARDRISTITVSPDPALVEELASIIETSHPHLTEDESDNPPF